MIKIGARITLEIYRQGEIRRYRCKLIEHEEGRLFVDYPINVVTGRTEIFETGTRFLANFLGMDGAVYQFATELIAKKKLNVPALAIDFPGKEGLKRIQRREHVRVETSVDIAVHSRNKKFPPFTTITYDISGGGAAVLLPPDQRVQANEALDIWMVLPMDTGGYEYIYTEAASIRFTEGGMGTSNFLSIKFQNMEKKDEQTMVRFCFERQLKERQINSR